MEVSQPEWNGVSPGLRGPGSVRQFFFFFEIISSRQECH